MNFPNLASGDTSVNGYCDFIEYSTFINSEMVFNDFDINESSFTLDDILTELKRRIILYDSFKPYIIEKRKVKSLLVNKARNLTYFYCLYYSVIGGNSKSDITNIFERISDISLKKYFNTKTSIITSIGQNSKLLKSKIDKIRSELIESKGSDEHMPEKAKDGGIDIITYKRIDNRGNQIICLTDATIGKNWRTEKMVKNQLNSWSQFIHFKLKPLTCISIVHVINPEYFHTASNSNGLLFDRTRVLKYYSNTSSISKALEKWYNEL